MSDASRTQTVSQLVSEHYELLYRFAFRLCGSTADAEDLVQQAFLTAHVKLGQLRDPEKARAWLIAVVRNAFRKNRRRDRPQTAADLESIVAPGGDAALEQVINSDSVQAALADLPEEFRSAVILFYFEEFSYKQIAELLDVPIGTVMSRLSRGKSQLRDRLQPQYAGIAAAATEPRTQTASQG